MLDDVKPAGFFVKEAFALRNIRDLIAEWPLDPEMIQKYVTEQLDQAGVYFIRPREYNAMQYHIYRIIKNSGMLRRLIRKAKKEEAAKRRSRFVD